MYVYTNTVYYVIYTHCTHDTCALCICVYTWYYQERKKERKTPEATCTCTCTQCIKHLQIVTCTCTIYIYEKKVLHTCKSGWASNNCLIIVDVPLILTEALSGWKSVGYRENN